MRRYRSRCKELPGCSTRRPCTPYGAPPANVDALKRNEGATERKVKKAEKGFRGWPLGTIATYGPDRRHATEVAVGIVRGEGAEAREMRDRRSAGGDIRSDMRIVQEILEFLENHGVLSIVMADAVIGCPHRQGIDYDGEWCPAPECRFRQGRDRFTGELEG